MREKEFFISNTRQIFTALFSSFLRRFCWFIYFCRSQQLLSSNCACVSARIFTHSLSQFYSSRFFSSQFYARRVHCNISCCILNIIIFYLMEYMLGVFNWKWIFKWLLALHEFFIWMMKKIEFLKLIESERVLLMHKWMKILSLWV